MRVWERVRVGENACGRECVYASTCVCERVYNSVDLALCLIALFLCVSLLCGSRAVCGILWGFNEACKGEYGGHVLDELDEAVSASRRCLFGVVPVALPAAVDVFRSCRAPPPLPFVIGPAACTAELAIASGLNN